jgi:hypothetical protein
MNLSGASTYLLADPGHEINMDRMHSPYLSGLSSESPIESLIAAHKIAPFEVQGVKPKIFFRRTEFLDKQLGS